MTNLLLRGHITAFYGIERYSFDGGPCRSGAGWCQVDTRQDASYFGVWTNPWSYQILSFAEGDVSIEIAFDAYAYRAGVVQMLQFYDHGGIYGHGSPEGFRAKIDCFTQPKERDLLTGMGLASYLH